MPPARVPLLIVLLVGVASAAVTVVELPAVRIPASSHSATVTMRLRSDQAERVSFSHRALVTADNKVVPATMTFSPAAVDFEVQRLYDVQIQVSGVLFEGSAASVLLANGAELDSLEVTRTPAAVVVVGGSQITFEKGRREPIAIRNNSNETLTLHWMVQLGADRYCGETPDCGTAGKWAAVTLPPGNEATLVVEPPRNWFQASRWFGLRGVARRAKLVLALPSVEGVDLPREEFPLQATLYGWHPGDKTYVILLLALGALFSLVVRHWVPNTQRKRDLKDRIKRVRAKIDGISGNIDSPVRVLARVECNLIDAHRKAMWTIVPDYESIANTCAQGLRVLDRRVDLIEEADSIYDLLAGKWRDCPPPSQIDAIERLLRATSEPLRRPQPQEADFLAARKLIDDARNRTERLGSDDPEFGNLINNRKEALKTDLAGLQHLPEYRDLRQQLGGIFARLESTDPIRPDQFSAADYDLSALEIVRGYLWLLGSSVPELKLRDLQRELVERLGRQSWNELRQARLRLTEYRENSTREDLERALAADPPEACIEMEPARPEPWQAVQFRVRFYREELNWAAAQEGIACVWDFGDGENPERGWSTTHFFRDESLTDRMNRLRSMGKWEPVTYEVNARFESDGKQLPVSLPPRKVTPATDQRGRNDAKTRSFYELIGLAASVAVPFLSLISGATQKLFEGGATEVFLLGFSSETILSVFKPRQQQP